HPEPDAENGIRLAAGDLDRDGRDEILVTTGWGGNGIVQVLGPDLRPKWSLQVYQWPGWGMNVAAAARDGLPLRADPVRIRLRAGKRVRVVAARFHDAAGTASPASGFRATVSWGDATTCAPVLL